VERAYKRAHALCEALGDTPGLGAVLLSLFPVHLGLRVVYLTRGQHQVALEHADHLLLLAETSRDPELLLEAHRAMGETLYYLGRFVEARPHLEQAIELDRSLQHRSRPFLAGHSVGHSGVFSGAHLAYVLWMLGFPDQALRASDEALALARSVSDFPSIAFALHVSFHAHQRRGEQAGADAAATALVALTTEQGFPYWRAMGEIFQTWTRADREPTIEAAARMRHGIDAVLAIGTTIAMPLILGLVAQLHGRAGDAGAGLAALALAIELGERSEERESEAELHRVRGELLLHGPDPDKAQAEAAFRRALDLARRQQARGWELRAATSLARLLAARGQRDEARRTLEPIHGWFTEGAETADLRDANALLDSLR
jgi:predicted ATPase